MTRGGLNPVFYSECVTAARRRQTYTGRVAFLAALLLSLAIVFVVELTSDPGAFSLSRLARVGESYFFAIVGTQLVLVLLAAPAYTAGAVCLDRARGNLAHLLATDLSAGEIIWGKLGARLLPVVGLAVAGLPVLALATLLGGMDPLTVFGGFLVTVGVAVVGCALALLLSVWGRRPYEVVLAAYSILALLLLPLPAWHLLPWGGGGGQGPPPAWLEKSNPFWLAFAPYLRPDGVGFDDYWIFLGGCVAVALAMTLVAALSLRRAVCRETNRVGPRGGRTAARGSAVRFGLLLDFNPVLWREWYGRRVSFWVRALWAGYAFAAILATVFGRDVGGRYATFINGSQFAIGLLLVSVTSVTCLFEERVRGRLDVLLATPLPSSSIVWGKWWGTYRTVVLLTILPTALACWVAAPNDFKRAENIQLGVPLLVVLMLAYGAFVTSLGLALATWMRDFGAAVGLSVTIYLLLAGGSVLVLGDSPLGSVSPWFGVGELTYGIQGGYFKPMRQIIFLVAYAIAAVALNRATVGSFDRRLGRVEGRYPFVRPPPPLYHRSRAPSPTAARFRSPCRCCLGWLAAPDRHR
jgi:ABC-type transport system involved in multi-copper enzyme maturation permease subunit